MANNIIYKSYAPGRLVIIGEHVDYPKFSFGARNYTISAATQFGLTTTLFRKKPSHDPVIRATSVTYNDQVFTLPAVSTLDPSARSTEMKWANYLMGAVYVAREKGLAFDSDLEMTIDGNVPRGAGMSSSAAYLVSVLQGFDKIFGWGISRTQLAELAQAAEHSDFVGSKCGLLDQTSSINGIQDQAMLIDHGDYSNITPVDLSKILSKGYKFLLINSNVERELKGTFYNERREEVTVAGLSMQEAFDDPDRSHISAFTLAELLSVGKQDLFEAARSLGLAGSTDDFTPFKRAMHVLSEKERTLNFVEAAEAGHFAACCVLINECGRSLSMDGSYQISGTVYRNDDGSVREVRPYIDKLIGIIMSEFRDMPLPVGFRNMGGGGGGCVIGLMPQEYDTEQFRGNVVHNFLEEQRGTYETAFTPEFFEAVPSQGSHIINAR